jgi:hypothetical protein
MQQSPRWLPHAAPAAHLLPDPSRRGLREVLEPPAKPQPFAFLTQNGGSWRSAQQERSDLLDRLAEV